MADRLVSFLESELADAGDDYVVFQVLSDEELAAIDQDGGSELVLHPWIEAQTDIDPDICSLFGERSLFMRGLLEPSVAEDGTAAIVASDQLRQVAEARREGIGFIRMRTAYDGARAGRGAILQHSAGAFEEEVGPDGMHVFAACSYDRAASRLAEWALPPADQPSYGTRGRVPRDRWTPWLVNELGVDVRQTETHLLLPGPDDAPQAEMWVIAHGMEGALLATPVDDSFEVAPITASGLAELLTGRIARAVGGAP